MSIMSLKAAVAPRLLVINMQMLVTLIVVINSSRGLKCWLGINTTIMNLVNLLYTSSMAIA